jgi:hypothetical protein
MSTYFFLYSINSTTGDAVKNLKSWKLFFCVLKFFVEVHGIRCPAGRIEPVPHLTRLDVGQRRTHCATSPTMSTYDFEKKILRTYVDIWHHMASYVTKRIKNFNFLKFAVNRLKYGSNRLNSA